MKDGGTTIRFGHIGNSVPELNFTYLHTIPHLSFELQILQNVL